MSQPVAIRAATERDLELSTEDREVLTDSDIKALVRWMDTMQNGVSAPERRLASTLLGRTLPPPIYLLYTWVQLPIAWCVVQGMWLSLLMSTWRTSDEDERLEKARSRHAWSIRTRIKRRFSTRSRFVRFHSLQAILRGAAFWFPTVLTCGVGLVLTIPYLIWSGKTVDGASRGEWTPLPLLWLPAWLLFGPKRQLAESTPVLNEGLASPGDAR